MASGRRPEPAVLPRPGAGQGRHAHARRQVLRCRRVQLCPRFPTISFAHSHGTQDQQMQVLLS